MFERLPSEVGGQINGRRARTSRGPHVGQPRPSTRPWAPASSALPVGYRDLSRRFRRLSTPDFWESGAPRRTRINSRQATVGYKTVCVLHHDNTAWLPVRPVSFTLECV
ncbi:hypothetical protein J6590_043764 [Homalodisca vitripennis]|nr:hypothetical protein J6590_043764 [Homalodisca vitripennis]